MSTEHRRAPRREVVDISRIGAWGQVSYQHKLSCGHIESRPRASTSKMLACVWCLRSESINKEMLALAAPPVQIVPELEQSINDFETDVEKIRAGISSKFSIPLDAVDIQVSDIGGQLVIKSGVVFLSAQDVARLGRT